MPELQEIVDWGPTLASVLALMFVINVVTVVYIFVRKVCTK